MKAVTTALIPSGEGFHFGFGPEDEGIKNSVFSELERLLRMDRWAPSFQYTVSQAALAAKEQLSLKGIGTLTFSELLLYMREGVFDVLRAQAFDILLNLGAPRHPPLVKFIFFTLRNDPSLFIRHRLVRSIGTGFGSMALTGNVQAKNQTAGDEMVIEEDAAQSVAVRKDLLERASISGAIQALRKELSTDDTLKEEMWNCAKYNLHLYGAYFSSSQLDLSIRQRVLDLCRILYDEKTSYIVVLQLPKKRKRFVCHHLGKVLSNEARC
jgi:transcription initiation factor TFIID subunit 2